MRISSSLKIFFDTLDLSSLYLCQFFLCPFAIRMGFLYDFLTSFVDFFLNLLIFLLQAFRIIYCPVKTSSYYFERIFSTSFVCFLNPLQGIPRQLVVNCLQMDDGLCGCASAQTMHINTWHCLQCSFTHSSVCSGQ